MCIRKICAVVLILSLVGCANTQGNIPRDTEADKKCNCSRFEAAWNLYTSGLIFDPVKATNRAIGDCKRGELYACLCIPFAAPVLFILGVVGAPFLIPIVMLNPDVKERGCPEKVTEISLDAANSNEQQK
jgi:hypothetical protein